MIAFDEDQILSEIFASNTLRDKGVNLNIAISENGTNIQKQKTFLDKAVDIAKATPGAVGEFGIGLGKGFPVGPSKFGTEVMDTITDGAYSKSFIPFVNEKLPIIGDINNYINNLLKPEGTAQKAGAGFGEAIGQVVVPGAIGAKALQGTNISSSFLRNVLGYGSAEVIGMNPKDPGLIELGTSLFVSNDELKKEIIDSLKADEDETVLMQKLQKAPQRFFEGGVIGEYLGKALEGVGTLYRAMKGSDKIKNALGKIGEKAQRELDLDANTTTLSSMGAGEIDKAINKGLAKLKKPTNEKDGIIAFHGSGADFDEFKLSKIGTGEGNQVFGYGLYFTDSKDIAKFYKDALSDSTAETRFVFDGTTYERGSPEWKMLSLIKNKSIASAKSLFKILESDLADGQPYITAEQIKRYKNILDQAPKKSDIKKEQGRIYDVNIKTVTDNLLDNDLPLDKQPKSIQEKINSLNLDYIKPNMTGEDIYDFIAVKKFKLGDNKLDRTYSKYDDKKVSKFLNSVGIKGIKYKAGQLTPGQDTSNATNFVIFDDKIIEIMAKYGIVGPVAVSSLGLSKQGDDDGST